MCVEEQIGIEPSNMLLHSGSRKERETKHLLSAGSP